MVVVVRVNLTKSQQLPLAQTCKTSDLLNARLAKAELGTIPH